MSLIKTLDAISAAIDAQMPESIVNAMIDHAKKFAVQVIELNVDGMIVGPASYLEGVAREIGGEPTRKIAWIQALRDEVYARTGYVPSLLEAKRAVEAVIAWG